MKKAQYLICIVFIISSSCNNANNKNSSNKEVDTVINAKPVEIVKENTTTDIRIGTQTWMSKNLDVTTYRNGDIIPQVQNPDEFTQLKSGAWCYYNNDIEKGKVYGKIYNNYAVNDLRGLAPNGYHVASSKEWSELTHTLGNLKDGADKLKSKDTWQVIGTDVYGMNIKGGGYLMRGIFTEESSFTKIWTSTYEDVWISYNNRENWNDCIVFSSELPISLESANGQYGYYVRCIKD